MSNTYVIPAGTPVVLTSANTSLVDMNAPDRITVVDWYFTDKEGIDLGGYYLVELPNKTRFLVPKRMVKPIYKA